MSQSRYTVSLALKQVNTPLKKGQHLRWPGPAAQSRRIWVSNVTAVPGGGRLLCGQLGGTFRGASYHHYGPGYPVHRCPVAMFVHCARPWESATCRQPPTTPQSNSKVERFHWQLKVALCARCSRADWLEHLPWVLLSLRATPKEEAGVSVAEATYRVSPNFASKRN